MNTKNQNIKLSIEATKKRRQTQVCKTYICKIDKSHLSKDKLNFLRKLFIEAKWLYNYQLSLDNIFDIPDNIKEVTILNKDKLPEQRELKTLSSQMIQELIQRTKTSIYALSQLKTSGFKAGKLKYKSFIGSVPLKQYNNTYKIINDKYIKIQGYKKHFKIRGLKQIPKNVEYTRATLVNRLGDFYLLITCYLPKLPKELTGSVIGLDFGIKDNITTSNGEKYNFSFPETRQIKQASKKVNKAKLGSSNRNKKKKKLSKAYQNLTNQKKDTKNKIVSKLVKENDKICIQDENIHQWKSSKMKGWGKRIHHSIMGGIISDLKKRSETTVIDRWYPSTKLCPTCYSLNVLKLSDRIYKCKCGYSEDRDVHSAKNILSEGLKISTGRRNLMPVEKFASILIYLNWFIISVQASSMKQEAMRL
jgi:transposase